MITLESTQISSWATTASTVVTKPTSLAVGDLMIARYVLQVGYVNFNFPSGFTLLGYKEEPGFQFVSFVYYKVADAADVAASNFTFTSTNPVKQIASISRVTGFDSDTSLLQIEQATVTNSATPSYVSTLTPPANSLIMQMWLSYQNVTNTSGYAISVANPSWSESYDSADTAQVSLAYATRPETSSFGTVSCAGGTAGSTDWALQLIVIKEAVYAPITVESVQNAVGGTGTSISINKPSGLAVDDLLVGHILITDSSAPTITPPSGFTTDVQTGAGGSSRTMICHKIATSADVAASSFTWTSDVAGEWAGGLSRITGHDATTPVENISNASGTGATATVGGLTPVITNNMVCLFLSNQGIPGSSGWGNYSIVTSAPTFTENYDYGFTTGSERRVAFASGIREQVTATGNGTADAASAAATNWTAIMVVIKAGLSSLLPKITHSFYFSKESGTQYLNFKHRNSSSESETKQVAWTPTVGQPYHVAMSINDSTISFLVNGAVQGATDTISYTREHNATADFLVGATGFDTETLDGQIDEVRVWKYHRTAAEILANKSLELTGAEGSLVSYYKFNNDLLDAVTANNNDLTGVNDPSFSTRVPFGGSSIYYPNHVLHRHSDGRLYVADVVDNQGTIHFIKTRKTTVEGDTDDGSTYSAVQVGYGLYPTALESYGTELVIALYEGTDTGVRGPTGKLAFWDTTSDNINSIIFVEFPDSIITALKNVNGVLYIVSTNSRGVGYRVSRLVGGYSIQEVAYNEYGQAPLAGGIDGTANRLIFGSATQVPKQAACVFSLGLQKTGLSDGLFNIGAFDDAAMATAVKFPNMSSLTSDANSGFGFYTPMVGWSGASTVGEVSVISPVGSYDNQVFWTAPYRIGHPFQITSIRIPFVKKIIDGMAVIPKIYMDDGETVFTLTEINATNDLNKYSVYRRSDANSQPLKGQNSFFVAFEWNGTRLCTIALPIEIEYELTNE